MNARAVALLVVLAVLPFLPGLRHDFVFDDHGAITANTFYRQPDAWARIATLETYREPRLLDGTRPVLLASVLIERALGARAAWQHRPLNYALHAGCALLLFGWVRGLLRRAGRRSPEASAFAAALVFALHPLALEPVQVPSYREDLLALFFILAALAAAPLRRAAVRIPIQTLAIFFALGSKETAFVLPLFLAWTWLCLPAERPAWRHGAIAMTIACAATGLVAALVLIHHAPQATAGPWNGISLQWPANLWTAPRLFADYLRLLAAPWPLCADRVVTPIPHPWALVVAGGVLALALALLPRALRRQPLLVFAAGWLVIAFLPVSNLVPLHNPFADRYAYALLPGWALFAAALPLEDRVFRRGLGVLLAAYVLLVQLRLPDWRNDAHLWSATLRVEPRSARAHSGLGVAALEQGALESARRYFERADELNPQDVTALVNLAVLDGQQGAVEESARKLEAAVQRRPDKAEAWANLAVVRELQGRRDEALDAAERAASLDPLRRW